MSKIPNPIYKLHKLRSNFIAVHRHPSAVLVAPALQPRDRGRIGLGALLPAARPLRGRQHAGQQRPKIIQSDKSSHLSNFNMYALICCDSSSDKVILKKLNRAPFDDMLCQFVNSWVFGSEELCILLWSYMYISWTHCRSLRATTWWRPTPSTSETTTSPSSYTRSKCWTKHFYSLSCW